MTSQVSAASFMLVDTTAKDWEASPSSSVWRKRLELDGPVESGRVTSVVRYDANSQFSPHPHPDGEEILVLSGVFSDEHGDYPAGSYLLNPEGFSHAPHSRQGCELFVKLRQYRGLCRTSVRVDTVTEGWCEAQSAGLKTMNLYREPDYPESMQLWCFSGAAQPVTLANEHGVELFVLEGGLKTEQADLHGGCWAKYRPGKPVELSSADGATLYLKTDHL